MMTNIDFVRTLASMYHVTLSKESIHALAAVIVCKKHKKGERVLDAGSVCDCLRFIEKGMLRQFYFKYDKDLTEHIGYEISMVVCLESYFKQEPTRLMIEALEPTVLWELKKEDMERLSEEKFDIGTLYRRFFEQSLIESQVKADILRFEPAHERYLRLLKKHPEILKRAPLVYIASFLQMTPETLSRVRSSNL